MASARRREHVARRALAIVPRTRGRGLPRGGPRSVGGGHPAGQQDLRRGCRARSHGPGFDPLRRKPRAGLRRKQAELADAGLDWVLIGHLQTNKAKDVARLASEVQSLDRPALAEALDKRLQHEGRAIDVLVEVKTSPEEAKHGLAPDQLPAFLQQLESLDTLRVRGLMTMAVHSADPRAVRACFRQLRQLRDRARDDGFDLPRLSMGMSGDFALAIAEGATEVRIGRAIFGERVVA